MPPRLRRVLTEAASPARWIVAGAAAFALVGTAGTAGASRAPEHRVRTTATVRRAKAHHTAQKPRPLGHAVTLTFFVKPTKAVLKSSSGRTLHAGTAPVKGDSFHAVDRDYSGSHVKHSRRPAATDSLTCTYTSATAAKCTYEITVGSSQVTARHVPATIAAGITSMPVNGGTGKYQGGKGLITETKIPGSRNSDLSIVVLPASS